MNKVLVKEAPAEEKPEDFADPLFPSSGNGHSTKIVIDLDQKASADAQDEFLHP